MSNQDSLKEHPTHPTEPSDRGILLSALGWIGVIFIFGLIVLITYVPTRSADDIEVQAEQRLEIRERVDAEQERLFGTYEWVDQPNGVLRIPIERAMELTVAERRNASSSDAGAAEGTGN